MRARCTLLAMPSALAVALACALAIPCSPSAAFAQDDGKGHGAGTGQGRGLGEGHGHDKDHDKDDKDHGKGGEHGEHKGLDGGVAVKRTPEQEAFRKSYLEKEHKKVRELAHKNAKAVTHEERNAIRRYWRHVTRLLRVREIAQDAKDDATVKRVDALLEKADKNFEGKLGKLNEAAPVRDGGAAKGGAQ